MSAFYVWNPHLVSGSSGVLEFVLTNGDVSGIAQDTEFFEMVLKDMGLEMDVVQWSIEPCRSKYYSEYLGEDEWQDIWQLVWKVSVATDQPIHTLPQMQVTPWIPTNATGQNWLEWPFTDKVVCFVVSDFAEGSDLNSTQLSIVNSSVTKKMQERYSVGEPEFSYTEVLGKYKQLQISLGKFSDDFFEEGADYAEYILDLCQEAGGTINFEARLG